MKDGDVVAGAIGGTTASLLNPALGPAMPGDEQTSTALLTATTMLAGGIVSQSLGHDPLAAASAAQNETFNNWLSVGQKKQWRAELDQCAARGCSPEEIATISARYKAADTQQDTQAQKCEGDGCNTLGARLASDIAAKEKAIADCGSGPTLCAAQLQREINWEKSLLQQTAGRADALQPFNLVEQFLTQPLSDAKALFTGTTLSGEEQGLGWSLFGLATLGVGSKLGAGVRAVDGLGAKGVGEASSLANAARLRGQLAGQEIAGGHAFEKHVLNQGEFKGLGIRTREQFANHIEDVVNNPTASRQLSGGGTAYWQDASGTVVIRNPRATDGGTAFQPTNGRAYFDGLR